MAAKSCKLDPFRTEKLTSKGCGDATGPDQDQGDGLVSQTQRFVRAADRYSYVFDGQSGELDHALAGEGLSRRVTGATIWHVNSDEPVFLDYNTEFNPPAFYWPDAFRSSDHDPVLLGLNLR